MTTISVVSSTCCFSIHTVVSPLAIDAPPFLTYWASYVCDVYQAWSDPVGSGLILSDLISRSSSSSSSFLVHTQYSLERTDIDASLPNLGVCMLKIIPDKSQWPSTYPGQAVSCWGRPVCIPSPVPVPIPIPIPIPSYIPFHHGRPCARILFSVILSCFQSSGCTRVINSETAPQIRSFPDFKYPFFFFFFIISFFFYFPHLYSTWVSIYLSNSFIPSFAYPVHSCRTVSTVAHSIA